MGKFLLGFALGMGVGAGIAVLLTPTPGAVNREKLRARTDLYASGDEGPVGTVVNKVEKQKNRIQQAIEAGRQASAQRQAELWQKLDLSPPELSTDVDKPL